MQRQDEFLRQLLEDVKSIQAFPLAHMDRGLRDLVENIETRLPLLKPVVYENHDLSSGTCIKGEVICSTRKGIDHVMMGQHAIENIETFWRPAYQRMQKQLTAVHDALK